MFHFVFNSLRRAQYPHLRGETPTKLKGYATTQRFGVETLLLFPNEQFHRLPSQCYLTFMSICWFNSARWFRPLHFNLWLTAMAIAIAVALAMVAHAKEASPLPTPNLAPPDNPNSTLPSEPELDIRRDATVAAVERVMPAVVNIATRTRINHSHDDPNQRLIDEYFGYSRQPESQISRGSGVVIDPDGYVLTNVHVVQDVDDIYVQFPDSPLERFPADRISLSVSKDIAVLKIRAPAGKHFRTVKLAKPDDLLLGETVLALGNPFGLGGSVSRGILSSKSRRSDASITNALPGFTRLDIPDWLQTDASINPGNSGGPLVNLRGELIGIAVAVLRPEVGAQGIGFAIPVKRITEAMAETLSGDSIEGLWFGARLKPELNRLTVTSLQPGSPAEKSGLRAGDIILQADNKPAGSLIDFNRTLVAAGPDRLVKLQIRRDSAVRSISLQLRDEAEFFNPTLVQAKTGIGLKLAPGGFVISSVEANSPAAKIRLRPGMYIVGFEGVVADDLVALAKVAYEKRPGESLRFNLFFREGWNSYKGEIEVPVR